MKYVVAKRKLIKTIESMENNQDSIDQRENHSNGLSVEPTEKKLIKKDSTLLKHSVSRLNT
jgi:hypothetical protein